MTFDILQPALPFGIREVRRYFENEKNYGEFFGDSNHQKNARDGI
jgi:hypothetical protein